MTFSSRARRCGTLQTLSVGDGLARKPISDCCVCIMIVMLKGCLGFVVAPEYICIELQYIVGVDHVCIPRPPTTVSPLALESCSRLSGSMAWLETGRLATRVHLIGSRSLSRWHCLPPSQQTDTRIRPFGLCRQCCRQERDPSLSASPATGASHQPCVAPTQYCPPAKIGEFVRGPLHTCADSVERVSWSRPSLPLHTTPHSLFRTQQTASRYLYSSPNDRPPVSCRGESVGNPTPRDCLPVCPPLTKLVFLSLVNPSHLVSL
jgi:hypothetical protein